MSVVDDALTGLDARPRADAEPAADVPPPAAGRAVTERRFVRLSLPSVRGIVASLRWRLTLTYSLVVFLMLSSFSMGAYYYFAERAITDIQLASRDGADFVATRFRDALQRQSDLNAAFRALPDGSNEALRRLILDFVNTSNILNKLDELRLPGVDFQLFQANGQRAYSSRETALAVRATAGGQLQVTSKDDPLERLTRIIPADVRSRATGRGVDAYVAQFGEESFYVYSRPVMQVNPRDRRAEPVAYIQILTSLTPHHRALTQLRSMLVLGTLFATLLSLLIGAALAQTAIAPIGRIQRTADKINREQDLGRRIERSGAEDELGRLTVTINLMLDRIEGMFDRQRRFLADVSHELRTPLTTIRGEVELMSRTGHTDPDALKAVHAEAERMSRMIDDLLMLARADSGVPVVKDARPVSLDGVLLDVYQQGCMLARGSHRLELDVDEPAVVRGDPDRLKQLALNLVTNALTHTPAGTIVRLGLRRDGRDVIVTVADNGPGIPAADREHIFDRFYRADKARARASGGTGLGLAIVRSIAQAHGGAVAVESAPGHGTRFEVRLPAV